MPIKMLNNEEKILKKGMDCLSKNLGLVETEMFISALIKNAYDYTQWRQEYFEGAYRDDGGTQVENFFSSAAKNDPIKKSY